MSSGDNGEDAVAGNNKSVVKTRPPHLEISYQEEKKYQYSEVISPATPPPSRFQIKWSAALHHERFLQTRSRQRVPRAVRIYYRKQKKDIATLKEARKLSSLGSENDLKGLSERFEEEVKKGVNMFTTLPIMHSAVNWNSSEAYTVRQHSPFLLEIGRDNPIWFVSCTL